MDFSLDRLLHPVDQDSFLRLHWEREPLVIERGDPDYYASILRLADIDAIVGYRQLQQGQLKIARTEPGTGVEEVFHVEADSSSDVNRLFHSYAGGDTVALNFVHRYWEPAARLCAALEHALGFPAGANVYLTPKRAQGFPPHYDGHDVFVLQAEGEKLWRLYGPREQFPSVTKDNQPIPRDRLGAPTREVRLGPGDLLYVPRGHVHEARTGDASSLHLTLGVRAYRWADLLGELLHAASEEHAELDQALPAGLVGRADAAAALSERLPELLRVLAGGAHLEAALARLHERLLERVRPLPSAHFHSLDRLDQLHLDSMVARRPGMLCRVSRTATHAEIAFPGNRLKAPAAVEPALRFLAATDQPFAVRALPSGLSDDGKLVLARRAIKEGLLSVLPS